MINPFLPIIVEHEDYIIINKPVGVSMHTKHGANGFVLPTASQEMIKQETPTQNTTNRSVCDLLQTQHDLEKVYLVHRLDDATSGCLLLAKSKSAAAILSEQFANRSVTKYYLALCDNKPKKKQGKIQGLMKTSRGGSYVLRDAPLGMLANEFAVTFFFSQLQSKGNRIFYIKPITGKTHQIRVALKALGSTILGDIRYKGTPSDRLYLHSHILKFNYLGEQVSVSCLPQTGVLFDQSFINDLQKPEDMAWPRYKMPNISIGQSRH